MIFTLLSVKLPLSKTCWYVAQLLTGMFWFSALLEKNH